MALRRNSLVAGAIAAVVVSGPAMAGGIPNNYIYYYMGHSDSITIGLGDAPTSNIIIQHPTPWPAYINNTHAKTLSQVGISALTNLISPPSAPAPTPNTVINIGSVSNGGGGGSGGSN